MKRPTSSAATSLSSIMYLRAEVALKPEDGADAFRPMDEAYRRHCLAASFLDRPAVARLPNATALAVPRATLRPPLSAVFSQQISAATFMARHHAWLTRHVEFL